MTKIGTKVIANDGFNGGRIGQVVDHQTTRFGVFHVVLIDGQFDQVMSIGAADMRGIGWKVATDAELSRAARYRDEVQA